MTGAAPQQSISLTPCFSLGSKLLAPELSFTTNKTGQSVISARLEPQKTGQWLNTDALANMGLPADALQLSLYDVIQGLGIELEPSLQSVLSSPLQQAQLTYVRDTKSIYATLATEHFSVVLLSVLDTVAKQRQTLCTFDCNIDLDLAALLPLTDPQSMSRCVLSAGLVYANKALTKAQVQILKNLCIEAGGTPSGLLAAGDITQGVGLVLNMLIDDETLPLYLPLQRDTQPAQRQKSLHPSTQIKDPSTVQSTTTTNTRANTQSSASKPVGKTLGPLHLSSFGATYDGELILTLDASLQLSAMQMEMMGLALKLNFTALMQGEFSQGLGFDLDGLYLALKKGGFELSGGLLRSEIPEQDSTREEYVGQLVLRTGTFSLTALAAYSKLSNGDNSLFAYLALNYPLGGVPPFFVEGLALGFGYNRGVNVPQVQEVNRFPLVTALRQGQSVGTAINANALATVKEKFQMLSQILPAESGQYVIAAGIKFSTFKLVNSVAVLMVEFGNQVAVHMVGLSDMRLPYRARNPVVSVEMAYRVSVVPDTGVLQIDAQLTDNSFVFSRDCKLTGGFAYYAWFKGEYAGDFAISLGGYHPRFAKPSYYPVVPRLGFVWQLNDNLSFKGEMYTALTPVAIMAGGGVAAVFKSGPLSAWFSAGLDFIIYWQPFYYDAHFYVNVGAEVELDMGFLGSVSFSTELGADLHVWGPEFSGIAKVNWAIFEFSIEFGAGALPQPDPISWPAFEALYIPEKAQDLTEIAVLEGELSRVDDWIVVDPELLVLRIGSQIPLTSARLNEQPPVADSFHLAPMGAKAADHWSMNVSATGGDNCFTSCAIRKNYPQAVWGSRFQPSISSSDTTLSLLSGLKITPAPATPPTVTDAVSIDSFAHSDVVENDLIWSWGHKLSGHINPDPGHNAAQIAQTLTDPEVTVRRDQIAAFFACEQDIDVSHMQRNLAEAFVGTPDTMAA